MDFSEINIGDIAIFEKSYDLNDFEKFSSLSNDSNPLHHEEKYALESGFKSPI